MADDSTSNPSEPTTVGVPPATAADGLSDVARLRRDQVLDAAEAIIAGQGIHRLSLAAIEQRAGMSRGQLTYYFPTKESILLAVFERMLRRMVAREVAGGGPKPLTGRAWDCLQHALGRHLAPDAPTPAERELFSLQFTFLAQMAHRPDYRERLSGWQREWREMIAADLTGSTAGPMPVPPAVAAALIQAVFQGLATQLAVDPEAFDRGTMLAACRWLLAPLFGRGQDAGPASEP